MKAQKHQLLPCFKTSWVQRNKVVLTYIMLTDSLVQIDLLAYVLLWEAALPL